MLAFMVQLIITLVSLKFEKQNFYLTWEDLHVYAPESDIYRSWLTCQLRHGALVNHELVNAACLLDLFSILIAPSYHYLNVQMGEIRAML